MTGVYEPFQAGRWAEQFASGDKSVGDRLASHIRAVFRRQFLTLGLTSQEAEDLVQDCVAMVFDAIHEFDAQRGPLDAWLSGYARNVARAWWRGAYSRRRSEAVLD